jgi:hypothetical protein
MTVLTIDKLKPLTTIQYEQCREKALERVKSRIGERPQRATFRRELGPLWTILDAIALLVFIAALAVSSVHIVTHMGSLASQAAPEGGDTGLFVFIHQAAFIALAEGSMILFLVMFGISREGWRRWVYLALALLAAVFVLVANVQSGIGLLESLMPPLFTIGIGLKLENLIMQALRRRKDIDERYLTALGVWESATADSTQHPDYANFFKKEVWDALLKKNAAYSEAPNGFKAMAVRREMERDTWTVEAAPEVGQFEGGKVDAPPAPFPEAAPVMSLNGQRAEAVPA